MGVAHTSKAAIDDHRASGDAARQAERVFIVIKYGVFVDRKKRNPTNKEIARALNLDPGTVSARRSDLMKDNRITRGPQRHCSFPPNRNVFTWKAI